MGYLKVLNNRDAKKLLAPLEDHWGCSLAPLLQEHSFLLTAKQKLYLIKRDTHDAPTSSRINSAGLYFASLKDNQARLSIEGAQMVASSATVNKLAINADDAYLWIRGKDLEIEESLIGYQIVLHGSDVMGCGYAKNGTLLNFVPKTRRIHAE